MGSGSRTSRVFFAGFIFLSLGAIPFAYAEESPSDIALDSVTADHSSATADGTFAHGWKWEFHFTVPTGETSFKMKFSDFTNGPHSIPASTTRIFSPQSDHDSEVDAIVLTESDSFSDGMHLTGDLSGDPGRQIVVTAEVALPAGSAGGMYSGSYDVESDAPLIVVDTTPPVITLLGGNPQTLFLGNPYSEAGATASDDVDLTDPVTINSSAVNSSALGVYQVTYDAVDAAGNHATQVVRTVHVQFPGPPFSL